MFGYRFKNLSGSRVIVHFPITANATQVKTIAVDAMQTQIAQRFKLALYQSCRKTKNQVKPTTIIVIMRSPNPAKEFVSQLHHNNNNDDWQAERHKDRHEQRE
jgi:hypothetical protein